MFKEMNLKNDVNGDYPTVITFFTNNWRYKLYALKMRDKCNKLGLNYYVAEFENLKNYLQNTKMKPTFILQALRECKTDVLWIDADGLLSKKPEFLKGIDVDFAAKRMASHRERYWHVGTMYFKYNQKVLDMVERWVEVSAEPDSVSDEHAFDKMYKAGYFESNGITSSDLPATYFEILKDLEALPRHDSVVSHRISKDPNKLELKRKGTVV